MRICSAIRKYALPGRKVDIGWGSKGVVNRIYSLDGEYTYRPVDNIGRKQGTLMAREFRYNFIRRVVNRIFIWLLRLGIAPGRYYLLTVAGRKSGRLHSVPVVQVEKGNDRWLVAPYGDVDWVKNARASGIVHLSRGADRNDYQIRELLPESAAPILKTYVNENPITRDFFDARPDSPVSAFLADAKRKFVFDLIQVKADERTTT
jgi:deazaflavin-dependent oxidoreductase (nitroreductase family)